MSDELPDFPVDDATLLALKHALGGAYEVEVDGTHVLVGAEYSMNELLDFLANCQGRDPNEVLLQAGRDESELPEWERGRNWASAEIVYDTRIHYSKHDVIRALIAEIERLRKENDTSTE